MKMGSNEVDTQQRRLAIWKEKLGVPVTLLDGRSQDSMDLADVRMAVVKANPLSTIDLDELPAFPERKRRSLSLALERIVGFAPLSFLLLFGPAWIAVTQANALADRFYSSVGELLSPLLGWLNRLSAPLAATLGGDYGVVAMFPFLLLYALPTILIFTGLIAVYKSTGLIDRLSYGLHPLLRSFGLGGRDLVRGFRGHRASHGLCAGTGRCDDHSILGG